MADFGPVLAFTLREEGGFQCDPRDRGNWSGGVCGEGILIGTCRGISAPTLLAWLGPERAQSANPAAMRALDEATAQAIYGHDYWLPVRGPDLPGGLDLLVFDHAVMAGTRRSVRLLQAVVDQVQDGYLGPATLAAVGIAPGADLLRRLALEQERALRQAPAAPTFLAGWLTRLKRRSDLAGTLLAA